MINKIIIKELLLNDMKLNFSRSRLKSSEIVDEKLSNELVVGVPVKVIWYKDGKRRIIGMEFSTTLSKILFNPFWYLALYKKLYTNVGNTKSILTYLNKTENETINAKFLGFGLKKEISTRKRIKAIYE